MKHKHIKAVRITERIKGLLVVVPERLGPTYTSRFKLEQATGSTQVSNHCFISGASVCPDFTTLCVSESHKKHHQMFPEDVSVL